jgi:hypothetical protein
MSFLHARSAYSALLASAVVGLGAGCTAGYAGTVGGPAYVESSPGGAPPVVLVAAGPAEVDADVVYDPQPPVDDIEDYPSVVYGGITVYYLGGRWYRHGERGWGYYRNEPPELGRQREMHDRDPRWAQAREAQGRPEPARPGPGVAERQSPERGTPVAPRPDEVRAPERAASPATAAPAHAQPEDKTAPAAKKRKPAAKPAPARARAPQERR